MERDPDYERLQIDAHVGTHVHEHQEGRRKFAEYLVAMLEEPVGRVLEIGCHNGHETKLIAPRADYIFGIELGDEYLDGFRARGLPDTECACMDMHDLGPFGVELNVPFDSCFANNVIEHARGRDGGLLTLRGIRACLRLGGQLVGALPLDKGGPRDLPYHTWKVDEAELQGAILEAGFTIDRWEVARRIDLAFPGMNSPCSRQRMAMFRAIS